MGHLAPKEENAEPSRSDETGLTFSPSSRRGVATAVAASFIVGAFLIGYSLGRNEGNTDSFEYKKNKISRHLRGKSREELQEIAKIYQKARSKLEEKAEIPSSTDSSNISIDLLGENLLRIKILDDAEGAHESYKKLYGAEGGGCTRVAPKARENVSIANEKLFRHATGENL
jgi:hypothetical protein